MAGKSANAYVKIIVSSNVKQAMSDFAKAHPKLAAFGNAIKKVGVVGGIALAAVAAGFYAIVKSIRACLAAYESYMTGIIKVQRLTGMTAKATSILAGQLRLSGVDAEKGAAGLKFFSKNLDAAQQGTEAYTEVFKRLNVAVVDGTGKARDLDDVLADTRDSLAGMENGAAKTAITMKLFGRGGADLLPWLSKSADKIREFTKFLKDCGLVMSEQSMTVFAQYREDQRKLSMAWDAIKINAARAIVPLINKVMPVLIGLIKRAAGWLGRFAALAERKGFGRAFESMVPGGKRIIKLLQQAKAWWDQNRRSIMATITQAANLLAKLVSIGTWVGRNKAAVSAIWTVMRNAILSLMGPLGSVYRMLSGISSTMQWILSNIGRVTASGAASGNIGKGPRRQSHAAGGIVTRPEVALVGEAGPEAIIPLTKPARAAQVMAQAGIGTTVNVYLDGQLIESHVTKRQNLRARRLARGYS